MSLSIAEADDQLQKAVALEQEIAEELGDIKKQLSETESTAGTQILEARKAGDQKVIQKINDKIMKLRAQYDVSSKTHEAARDAIIGARHELNMARGHVLRTQAAELMKQVSERQKKTDELLAALLEHEGCRYLVESETLGGAYLAGMFKQTKTQKLATEAAELIQRAEALERQVCRVEPIPSTGDRKSGAVPVG